MKIDKGSVVLRQQAFRVRSELTLSLEGIDDKGLFPRMTAIQQDDNLPRSQDLDWSSSGIGGHSKIQGAKADFHSKPMSCKL